MMIKQIATPQMTATALKALARKNNVQLVGDGRRGDVRKTWIALINAALGVGQDNNLREVNFKAKRYYALDELPNYVAFNGYAVFQSDYSRYIFPDDFEFQKPVYKFVTGKGYTKMKSGFEALIAELRKIANADLRF